MRKILTLFVLSILLMQVMGYYIVFRIRQMELKSEVRMYLKSHIEDEHLTTFEFTTENGNILDKRFEWAEENEFSLAGSMYDVIEQRTHGNTITIRCVKDEQENELLNTFEQFQKRQSREKGRSGTLIQFLVNLYVSAEEPLLPRFNNLLLTSYFEYQSPLFNHASEILTPPPKNC